MVEIEVGYMVIRQRAGSEEWRGVRGQIRHCAGHALTSSLKIRKAENDRGIVSWHYASVNVESGGRVTTVLTSRGDDPHEVTNP